MVLSFKAIEPFFIYGKMEKVMRFINHMPS